MRLLAFILFLFIGVTSCATDNGKPLTQEDELAILDKLKDKITTLVNTSV